MNVVRERLRACEQVGQSHGHRFARDLPDETMCAQRDLRACGTGVEVGGGGDTGEEAGGGDGVGEDTVLSPSWLPPRPFPPRLYARLPKPSDDGGWRWISAPAAREQEEKNGASRKEWREDWGGAREAWRRGQEGSGRGAGRMARSAHRIDDDETFPSTLVSCAFR